MADALYIDADYEEEKGDEDKFLADLLAQDPNSQKTHSRPEVIEIVDPPTTKVEEPLTLEGRFNLLKQWSIDKGVIGLDNIDVPGMFYDDLLPTDRKFGVMGVVAKRDIKHREAILAVPFSLLISRKTFKVEEPELYEYVIKECPDLFNKEECYDYEQLLITVYLMNEWSKGKASKWYPVMQAWPQEQAFFCDWGSEYLDACQDPRLNDEVLEFKVDIDI